MKTKTILTNDIEKVQDALYEGLEYIGQISDERYDNPIVKQLQDAIDLLDSISL